MYGVWLLEAGFWEMPFGDVIRTDADAIAYMDVFTASPKGICQTCLNAACLQVWQTLLWRMATGSRFLGDAFRGCHPHGCGCHSVHGRIHSVPERYLPNLPERCLLADLADTVMAHGYWKQVFWERSYSSGAGNAEAPLRKRSMAAAAERPSAMAQTISDCPRCMSPAVNTPGTLVIQF